MLEEYCPARHVQSMNLSGGFKTKRLQNYISYMTQCCWAHGVVVAVLVVIVVAVVVVMVAVAAVVVVVVVAALKSYSSNNSSTSTILRPLAPDKGYTDHFHVLATGLRP